MIVVAGDKAIGADLKRFVDLHPVREDSSMAEPTGTIAGALKLVEELSLGDGTGVSVLARRTGMAKSTVQRTLSTLKAAGWVRQDASAKWALSLRCAAISQRIMSRTTLTEIVRPMVAQLRDETGETAKCYLIEEMNIVLLDVAESHSAVRAVEEGLPNAIPLHATSIGKAILAARPDVLASLLGSPLGGVTPKTITDPRRLRDDVERTARDGWAQVREETHLDVGGVAAVAQMTATMMVGVAIAYPLHRTSDVDAVSYGARVQSAATDVALLIAPRLNR